MLDHLTSPTKYMSPVEWCLVDGTISDCGDSVPGH